MEGLLLPDTCVGKGAREEEELWLEINVIIQRLLRIDVANDICVTRKRSSKDVTFIY